MRDCNVTNSQTAAVTLGKCKGSVPSRRLLRLKAAAEYLSLSPWKLRSLIQSGRLPVVQDSEGSPFLMDVRDLDLYVERNKRLTLL
jgi:excisionase family DNA binding protein